MNTANGLALAVFLLAGAQTLATMAVYALPVLVAYAAPDFGMARANIGYQVGLVYLCAVFASAYGPRWLAIWGPARTTQIALLSAALDGSLGNATFRKDPNFGFEVPVEVPGVDAALLDPRRTWADGAPSAREAAC